ncbi:MAG: hypothetical protein ACR2ML_01705 [Solirubrobacteraceae bacterium]
MATDPSLIRHGRPAVRARLLRFDGNVSRPYKEDRDPDRDEADEKFEWSQARLAVPGCRDDGDADEGEEPGSDKGKKASWPDKRGTVTTGGRADLVRSLGG